MTNKAFSRRMLDSKKRTGSGTQSYKWKYHPTPWKVFVSAVTAPQKTTFSAFGNKHFVLGLSVLILIIGTSMLGQGPLFHNYKQGPPVVGDPNTRIWDVNGASQNLGEFNSIMFSSSVDTCSGCLVFRGTPNSTESAVALTKNPVGDLSIAHAKQLYISWMWDTFGTCCGNQQAFGMYLTSNSTLPTQKNYNPLNDPQVALAITEQISSGSTFQQAVYIQKRIGETMTAEGLDCTNTGSTCFLSSSWQTAFGTGNSYESTQLYLNYTGNTGQSGCNQAGQGVGGQGCDVQLETELQKSNNSTGLSLLFGISKAPPFPLTSGAYYAGFYVIFGYPGSIEYFYSAGKVPTQSVTLNNGFTLFICTSTHIDEALPIASAPVAPSPTIDTGGFFGPVIRALIAIGVYIAQNIINFLAFLANVLFPVLATVFGVLANALVGALNAIGNFFGLGNIGTTIQSFFTAIGNFLVNGVSAVIGQIGNAVSFFVNGTGAFVNIAGTYWAKITSFFTALGNLLSIIGTVLNDFLIVGGFSGNLALFMDWTWGMYKTYDEGTEGFHRWLDFNENVFLRVGKVAYFLSDHLFTIILRVKQLIVQWV